MACKDISVLIATMNRPTYVGRLLRYYDGLGFEGTICIGDSSTAEQLVQMREVIASFDSRLHIVYKELPGLNDARCMQQLVQYVPTKYAALIGDDDFLVPNGLMTCADFLEKNSDYGAAHGLGILLNYSDEAKKVLSVGAYPQPSLEISDVFERFKTHFFNYSVSLFSVHHTQTWHRMYQDVDKIAIQERGTSSFGSELLPCAISVLSGKIKAIDCLYVGRTLHARRAETYTQVKDTFDWITEQDWQRQYRIFHDLLVDALVAKGGGLEDARHVVKQGVWQYLSRGLARKWSDRYEEKHGSQVLKRVKNRIKQYGSFFKKQPNSVSLSSLSSPHSTYHQDFAPIRQSLETSF